MSTISADTICLGRPVHHNSGTSEHGSAGVTRELKEARLDLLELVQ